MKCAFISLLGFALLLLPNDLPAQPLGLQYTTNNGAITVTGYVGDGEVDIPASLDGVPVVSIGAGAFQYRTGITKVIVPNSVTNIGDYAFNDCAGMTNISLSSNVTSIGVLAFGQCSSLPSVVIPANVTDLKDRVFASCTSLANITPPPV